MQLTRVRLKTGVQVDGQTVTVLDESAGWSITLGAHGVQAVKGELGVGAPLTDVLNYNFVPPPSNGPAPAKASK